MQRQCEEHLVLIDLVKRGERMEASHFLRNHLDGARKRKAPDTQPEPKARRA
jgi:DNA-binding GntR family transcriptional regulator